MIDGVTNFIVSLDNPILTTVSTLLENYLVYILVIATVVLLSERRQKKIEKIFFAVVLALLIAFIGKQLLAVDRPCVLELVSKIPCPLGYSLPSIHAAVAFTVAIAFLNKKTYPLYLLFALFIAFTRVYLGVHTFIDIAASLVVALIAYHITHLVWRRK